MSKVEHDPALVRWLENILRLVAKDEHAGDGLAEEIIEEIAQAVRAWDAEHAEPSAEALIEEIVGRDGTLTIYDPVADKPVWEAETPHFRPGCEGPTMRAALLALRDAVEGEPHA